VRSSLSSLTGGNRRHSVCLPSSRWVPIFSSGRSEPFLMDIPPLDEVLIFPLSPGVVPTPRLRVPPPPPPPSRDSPHFVRGEGDFPPPEVLTNATLSSFLSPWVSFFGLVSLLWGRPSWSSSLSFSLRYEGFSLFFRGHSTSISPIPFSSGPVFFMSGPEKRRFSTF